MEINLLRLSSIVALAIFLISGLSLVFNDRTNHCEMTYMFEYPKFVHVRVPGNENYPQYSLYAYSEGRLTEKVRKMRFDGIPVLYLPGNSGSRSQTRSLASVALRMSQSDYRDYHFDFFTVSFNEELSGLNGGVLESQTKFTSLAIRKILSLYKVNRHTPILPTRVILIGHSMGGVIAKRLLVYHDSCNMTSIAVTLAAPLAAPVINIDLEMDKYYMAMYREWTESTVKDNKALLSFGGGARDYMVPSSLIASEYSDFSGLVSAIPGVWVSTDHLSIVWCRQFMIVFNKFLFSIVDSKTRHVSADKQMILAKAEQYFQANRSMILRPDIDRASSPMIQDAFWYEDNRRIYQISRPRINRMTYLMIRLSGVHLDRFLAVETVNHEERDWLFGCAASFTHNNQRTCKNATSLSELVRWTAAAQGFGRRKLATVHLHELMMREPLWTHVLVKIPPTRDPIEINVDINDFASRNLTVDLPYAISYGKTVIMEQTEKNTIYYELLLPGMTQLHHAYLLYVEPTQSCGNTEYHASAEMHVPWAKNHEYYHFFTFASKKPMKLRLFKSNPNILNNTDVEEHVKVTLVLDPKCTFSISIEPTRYLSLAQLTRQHLHVVFPYVAGVILMATRSAIIGLMKTGACPSIHRVLAGEAMRPYYVLVFGRLGGMALASLPFLETSYVYNTELRLLTRSLLSLPLYMAALGAVNVAAAAALVAIVFCSQFAHRLVLRIIWKGGGGGSLAEKLAGVLQKAPVLVSVALVCSVPTSCGAAALTAAAAYYFFMLSKMYEEYLEDFAYKLLAKIGSKIRQYLKSRKNVEKSYENETTALVPKEPNPTKAVEIVEKVEDLNVSDNHNLQLDVLIKKDVSDKEGDNIVLSVQQIETKSSKNVNELELKESITESQINQVAAEGVGSTEGKVDVDEDLSGLNFHFIMFLLWMIVVLVNVPALLTWARNFKYSMVLRPDTSVYSGIVMSVAGGFLWQINSPRRNLVHYETVSQVFFAFGVLVVVLGPLASYHISNIVSGLIVIVTIQQLFDSEIPSPHVEMTGSEDARSEPDKSEDAPSSKEMNDNCEEKIHETMRNFKEKLDLS